MSIPLDSNTIDLMKAYATSTPCTWCDGCGDYGIWTATKLALAESGIPPHKVMMCFDVGCHGNGADKLEGYRFHGLHGRVLPFAAGCALANREIPVIAFGGDGASFSEGMGHFIHAFRSNYPFTFVLHNNANFGLTKGQASAVTWQDQAMNISPNGIPEHTLPSMDLVFSLEPTFVARTWSGDIAQMTVILKEALKHRGFAFIDVLQSCPTWNHFATQEWLMEHCKPVGEDHDVTDFSRARALAVDTSKSVATGLLYRNENVPHFYERLKPREGVKTSAVDEVKITDVRDLMREFV